ncbi:hypothetical protein [Amycolatopsis jejuensis]|uniref:hypothetical protein n=1 Tax=Amycolatopsis jejuensis TaxID=330084 RepID=UPI00069255BD|nr:hypothetical protein [Amycolatopsis jejuensis]
MTTYTLNAELTLVSTHCVTCGVPFAMPDYLMRKRREDGGDFYCPNGHSLVFRESEATKLKRRLEWAESNATHQRDQREAAERSNAALRGVITKQRKRAAAGVCACCNRSFRDVARHMASQHPGFVATA